MKPSAFSGYNPLVISFVQMYNELEGIYFIDCEGYTSECGEDVQYIGNFEDIVLN